MLRLHDKKKKKGTKQRTTIARSNWIYIFYVSCIFFMYHKNHGVEVLVENMNL